ncbi:hypothetical protein [Bdellovibrio sp. GT3]|uniref:hypothetical protein n=1 Tax=Bdellovibrio sp. GT3 TaxID=3136282 RepID=UPI0030F32693
MERIPAVKVLVVAIATLISGTASAVTITQQNLIPENQKSEFIGQGILQSIASESETDAKTTGAGLGLALSYYYGFGENNAIGVSTKYLGQKFTNKKTGDPDQTINFKGLENVTFLYKGNYEAGSSTLFFHGGFSLPAGPLKVEGDINTADISTSRGQSALIGTLGFVVPVGSLELGALTTYEKKAEGKVESTSSGTTTKYDSKGGDVFGASVFAELTGDLNLNFSLNYNCSQDLTYSNNSGSSGGNLYGSDLISMAAGMRTSVNETSEIVGSAEISSPTNLGKRDLKSYAQVDLNVGIRVSF